MNHNKSLNDGVLHSNRDNSEIDSSEPAQSETGSDDFRVLSVCPRRDASSAQLHQEGFHRGDQCRGNDTERGVENAEQKRLDFSNEYLTAWVQSVVNAERELGSRFSEVVRKNKNFQNPAIFDKMVTYCGIDENGTDLPKREALKEFEFYEAIAEFQEVCMHEIP